ncbi:MAG TPA: YhfX family PLP-dependent enzyme [Thermoanaerobacterales bacterium]|nr:YhfX family PLP-dependent enzyme [Thermoanaerobacterales bacterium]
MFLDVLLRRNRKFVETAIELHQKGEIPANSYVIDVDTVRDNAAVMAEAGKKYNFKIFAMTKQIGRNPVVLKAIREAGIDSCVAVDLACARAVNAAGLKVGHLGHLVQIPRAETKAALNLKPDYWTVFSYEKAVEISNANTENREQKVLARIYADGDRFYKGHEGGFPVKDILEVSKKLDSLKGIKFAGITTFPALLYDPEAKDVMPTHNLKTLEEAAATLAKAGIENIEINAPGTTSSVVFEKLADAGATQVEPGHGLTGTTPLHAINDLPERPAMLYLTEVSHFYGGKPYCFGGGLYIDPVFPPYPVKACVGSSPEEAIEQKIVSEMPDPSAIDYYGILQPEHGNKVREGDTVIFGFRAQVFVTRAYVVPISGIKTGKPEVKGIWFSDGRRVGWPEW